MMQALGNQTRFQITEGSRWFQDRTEGSRQLQAEKKKLSDSSLGWRELEVSRPGRGELVGSRLRSIMRPKVVRRDSRIQRTRGTRTQVRSRTEEAWLLQDGVEAARRLKTGTVGVQQLQAETVGCR